MAGERVILTYKDYEALPADGRRYEIHDGELSITRKPSPHHQRISGNLTTILWQHVKTHQLGQVYFAPIDCILSDITIVQPDLLYIDMTRLSLISDRGIEGAPTLAVEITSPPTTIIDRSTKPLLYAKYGVPYYWIVDPEARTIEVHVLSEGRYQLAARVFGAEPVSLPPFPNLAFAPDSLWF